METNTLAGVEPSFDFLHFFFSDWNLLLLQPALAFRKSEI